MWILVRLIQLMSIFCSCHAMYAEDLNYSTFFLILAVLNEVQIVNLRLDGG